MSESDVCRRQILMSKVGHRAEKVKAGITNTISSFKAMTVSINK